MHCPLLTPPHLPASPPQEYGAHCPQPNTNRTYISYLDSVRYLQTEPPDQRTLVYHATLKQAPSGLGQSTGQSSWPVDLGPAPAIPLINTLR